MFLLISKTCPMLQAQVFLQSLPPTTVPAAFLSCNYMVKLQSQGHVLLCQAFSAVKAPVSPTRLSARPAHCCMEQRFREFCFPQKRRDSGDTADAESRHHGCNWGRVARVTLKPLKGTPAWKSSICPALAPVPDLVAFKPFSFLLSTVVLTSVLYFRPQ